MRRRKRFAIKVFAGALAVAALAAPAAQPMPPELPGDQVRALHEAKANKVRAAAVKSVGRVSVPRRPIREFEPEG